MLDSEPVPAKAKLLLVEGPDDKHVVWKLRDKLAPELEFDCEERGGKDQLLEAIPVEMKTDGRLALGIMMDANDYPLARWQAIGHRLRKEKVELPAEPEDGGIVIGGDPRVGVWLMPNNSTSGELENFIEKLIPEDDPIWPLAKQYIDGIPSEHRKFKQKKELRAKIHAWLATREEPRKMGAAIGTGELDAKVELAREFVDWLRALFAPRIS